MLLRREFACPALKLYAQDRRDGLIIFTGKATLPLIIFHKVACSHSISHTLYTGKRGHIVAHDVSWAAQTGKHLLRTQNVSEQIRSIFCVPDTKFLSATNVARAGKRRNICLGNNVSSFARAFRCYICISSTDCFV